MYHDNQNNHCCLGQVANEFATRLGYTPAVVCCYRDMSPRDLFMRRSTDEKGNTQWETSAVVTAALEGKVRWKCRFSVFVLIRCWAIVPAQLLFLPIHGLDFYKKTFGFVLPMETFDSNSDIVFYDPFNSKLCVLDGIHRLTDDTLCSLSSLASDREVQLFDGTRLVSHDRFDQMVRGLVVEQQQEQQTMVINIRLHTGNGCAY